jgi:glycosyltransferase involved in cell wall biosynthesis
LSTVIFGSQGLSGKDCALYHHGGTEPLGLVQDSKGKTPSRSAVIADIITIKLMSTLVQKIGHVSSATARWIVNEWAAGIGRDSRRPAADAPTAVLLAWFFPPLISGGTYRPLSFVRHGSALGWRFVVIGGEPHELTRAPAQRLLDLVPCGTQVARVPEGRRYFFQIDGEFPTALDVVASARDLLGAIRPSVIIATGPPFVMFVAGRFLARRYRVPLVLDYRDEWTECPFDFVRKGPLDRWWERRALSSADLVIFTTESQRAHQLAVFPGLDAKRCVVIPNGWDPEDGDMQARPSDQASDAATVAFVGNLGEHTPPDPFLDTLASILDRRPTLKTKLTVAFVGQKSPMPMRRLETFAHREILSLLDQVSKDRAVDIMRRARSLLILNDPRLVRYLPGKIYDYLAARRPIIVFGDGGEVAALVRLLGVGVVIPHGDIDTLEEVLDRLLEDQGSPRANPHLETWLQEHTRAQLAQRLLATIGSLGGRRHELGSAAKSIFF